MDLCWLRTQLVKNARVIFICMSNHASRPWVFLDLQVLKCKNVLKKGKRALRDKIQSVMWCSCLVLGTMFLVGWQCIPTQNILAFLQLSLKIYCICRSFTLHANIGNLIDYHLPQHDLRKERELSYTMIDMEDLSLSESHAHAFLHIAYWALYIIKLKTSQTMKT